MKKRGTLVIVNQHCSKCGDYGYEWRSQPNTLGGKHVAGNVLLSFAILLAGASISKVLLIPQEQFLPIKEIFCFQSS